MPRMPSPDGSHSRPCRTCGGTGRDPNNVDLPCPTCEGVGAEQAARLHSAGRGGSGDSDAHIRVSGQLSGAARSRQYRNIVNETVTHLTVLRESAGGDVALSARVDSLAADLDKLEDPGAVNVAEVAARAAAAARRIGEQLDAAGDRAGAAAAMRTVAAAETLPRLVS